MALAVIRDPARLWKRYLIDLLKIGSLLWPSCFPSVHPYDDTHGYLRKCKTRSSPGTAAGGREYLHVVLPGILVPDPLNGYSRSFPEAGGSLILDFSRWGLPTPRG